jgi:hypothetical protein
LESLLELVEPPAPSEVAVVTEASSEEAKLSEEQSQSEANSKQLPEAAACAHILTSNIATIDLDKPAVHDSKMQSQSQSQQQQQEEERDSALQTEQLIAAKDQTDEEIVRLKSRLAELEDRNRKLAEEESAQRERNRQLELSMAARSYSEDTPLPAPLLEDEAQQHWGQPPNRSGARIRRSHPFLRRSGGLQASDGVQRSGNWPRRHWLQATGTTGNSAQSLSNEDSCSTWWRVFDEAEKAFGEHAWSAAAMAYDQVAAAVATAEAEADTSGAGDDGSPQSCQKPYSTPSLWRCYNRLGLARSKMAKAATAAGGVDGRRAAEKLNRLALEAYSYAIAVDGRRAEAYSNRGWKHLALGARDEARCDAEAALERDTTSHQAQQLLQKLAGQQEAEG